MNYFFSILFICLSLSASAQKREFLDENSKIITDSSLAKYVRISKPEGKKHLIERTYLVNGHLIEEARLTCKYRVRDGIWKAMYEKNGNIKYKIAYAKGKQNGLFRTYFENGQLRREELYKDNVLISGKCFTQAGTDTLHYPFATSPSFPGGHEEFISYLQKHLKTMVNNRQRAASNTQAILLAEPWLRFL